MLEMATTVTESLPPAIAELIKEKGWKDLTDVQKLAYKPVYEGMNTLIMAPTGHGKTEAAMLPILARMVEEKPEPLAVVYITPLKSLINDLKLRIEWWASKLGFIVARKHGDVSASERSARLKKVPHILLTTPEGLEIDLDWATQFRKYYKNVRWVVIDEAHELVNSKRGVQLSVLLERLKAYTGRDVQRIALSATIGEPELAAKLLFGSSQRPSRIIKVSKKRKIELTIDSIGEIKEGNFWEYAAKKILEHVEPPTLVFVNTRFSAERLHEELSKMSDLKVEVHHSSVSKEVRVESERLLREGKLDIVIATKTLELGIDISELKKVILFKPPGSVAALLQRVGRAGHKLGGVSRGVIITTDQIDTADAYTESILALKGIVEPPQVLDAPLDVLAREIIGMVLQEKLLDPEKAFQIVKGAYPYRNLSKEKFDELINTLIKNRLLNREGDKIKIGYMFYKLWCFDCSGKKWWSRSFGEFFSVITERDTFVVKWGNKTIGDLDAFYVYKYLRPDMKIRLAGRTWRIINIDEETMKVIVEPSNEQGGEVPLWRSEEALRSPLVPRYAKEALKSKPPQSLEITDAAKKNLKKVLEWYNRRKLDIPGGDLFYLEKTDKGYVLSGFMDQKAAETLAHILMYMVSSEYTAAVQVRASMTGLGLSVDSGDSVPNLLDLLKQVDDVEEMLDKALERSPYLVQVAKEIQLSFGKLGKVTPDDGLVYEEAKKQALQRYFNVEEAKRIIEGLKSGSIKVRKLRTRTLSPLASHIVSLPALRPWLKIVEARIANMLKEEAFTVEELSMMLELSPTTIENKLKEMRKPSSKIRVISFIDTEFGETRWTLLEDLDKVMQKEEYADSFKPRDVHENFVVYLRTSPKDEYTMKYFKPIDLIENPEKFLSTLNDDEYYEVKVVTPSDPLFRNLMPRYFYVPKKALPAVLLNAVTYIQRLRRSA
ncbi:ATP-dependent helicase [Ignicoccus pacificus DSM 13166]|uniref:ATP-dependent helicase n=1 Tax=Ignicoccus pacificus DSM 13166 TaxID=940294 RepID=A0A977PK31_9CREN|nr:ATP-dependent helicase [Ignicoccus pacificus DSM 13166]